MATEVGAAYVTLIPSARGFASKMQSEIGGDISRVGSSTGQQYGSTFSSSASKGIGARAKAMFGSAARGAAIVGAAAGALLVRELVKSVGSASDLGETLSKSAAIFGEESMPQLERFANQAATAIGQSKTQALNAASTFATFGKSAGLTGKQLVGFSTDFTSLASDLASFNNTTPQEAIDAIGAALRGETEPMRRYGVLLDDASMRAEALRLGLIKTTKDALTPQQKVLAAQALIYKQTADAQGDFEKTSDGLANQQRIMAAQTETLRSRIGKGLLPVFVAGAHVITEQVMPALSRLTRQHMPAITTALTDFVGNVDIAGAFQSIKGALSGLSAEGAGESISSLGDSFGKLVPVAQEFLTQLPGITDILSVASTVFGFLADHTDTLVKLMPYLVAGYVAMKVAQAAANAAQVLAVPLKVAEIIANRQLVKSNRELIASRAAAAPAAVGQAAATAGATAATASNTAATTANNTAQKAGIVTTLRAKAAAVASAVAQKAVAAATRAWAATQWLLNAAMSANPLGLIVAAIAALVIGVVLAYRRFETFRNIVDAVFGFLKRAVVVAVNVVKAVFGKIVDFLRAPMTSALAVMRSAWGKVKSVTAAGINAVVGFVKSLPGRAKSALSSLGGAIGGIFTSAFAKGRAIVTGAVDKIVTFVKSVPGRLRALGGMFATAGRNVIDAFVNGLKGAAGLVSDVAGNIWDSVQGLLNDAINKINAALEFRIQVFGKGVTINPPDIPHLATGGRATSATLAVIGEGSEPETVLPDSVLRGLLDRVAANARGGSSVAELRITNWRDGTGYFRLLADSAVHDDARFRRDIGAMHA